MVREIKDIPTAKGMREVVFRYDPSNDNDLRVKEKIENIISDEQSWCYNCKHFYYESSFGGYMACSCKIYGCLEVVGNPHYDCDGGKCDDYCRRKVSDVVR